MVQEVIKSLVFFVAGFALANATGWAGFLLISAIAALWWPVKFVGLLLTDPALRYPRER